MSKVTKIASYLLLIGFTAYFGFKLYFSFNQVKEGDKAPEIETTLLNGESFSLNSLKGKWVLIDFWGSWCGPCIHEFPELLKVHEELKNSNFEIVSIALEKNKEQGIKVSKQIGFNWKYQIIEEHKAVMLSPLAQKYGVTDIPAKFLVSPHGFIRKIEDFNKVIEIVKGE